MLLLCVPAAAQVPDLTSGGSPTDGGDINLGPTGLRGWIYSENRSSTDSRQILITEVEAGSPAAAAGTIAVDDVILGASGTGAEPEEFTEDARKSLAYAIADAEARDPGVLKLLRWRDGVTDTAQLTLETLGAYSATAPYECPKSAAILEKGLQWIMGNEGPGLFSLGTLVLLATDDPDNPNNAARQTEALSQIQAAIPSAEEIELMNNEVIETSSKVPWTRGHQLILFSEYYLKTGDEAVVPVIEALVNTIAKGQSPFGTMGHKFAGPWPDGSPNGPMHGYGAVNSAAVPAFLGLVLAKECGISHPKLDPGIERASRYFASYVGKGSIPYGENLPGGSHTANGKSGAAALAFEKLPERVDARDYFAIMSTASASERESGHTGTGFNYLWSPLGAAVGGEEAVSSYFHRASWHYDLSRRWNGSFEYRRLGDNRRGYSSSWRGDFKMSTAVLLTYALPLRNLHITGAGRDPAAYLSSDDVAQAELADAYAADSYVAAGRSTNQLIDDLSSFSSIVRAAASAELATRTSEIEQILATLESMAGDLDGRQRTGACVALGAIADPGSVPLLVDLLDDEDNHVRYFAATALLEMPQPDVYPFVYQILAVAARNATPTFPLPDEDPAQFANAQVLDLLFEHNHLIESLGSLADIDRSFLYPAIRAAVNHPLGRMRGFMKQGAIYSMLTEEDILALADVIVDGVYHKAPGDTMFSLQIRTAGMELLQPRNIAEGVPLAKIVHETHFRDGASADAIDYIGQYAGSATLVEPDPEVIEFLETFWVSDDRWDGNLWVNASAALDAIAADTNPEEPTPFKSIQSVTAEASTLTLPANRTKLRVDAFDYAKGDSRYTWRKVHGAGDVSFSPNGTAESRNSNVLFDGTPGQYLLEVTMSDSRGLTEVSQTVAVTLLSSDGTLPANTAPTADALAVDVAGATPTPVILTGSDPEGYDLSYKVISRPAHGRLVGTAPYLNYIPDFNYSGEDSFTYEVRDSEGQVSSATVNITVGATAPTGLTIYEPFDYATGALDGQSGTSEVGLSGTWSAPSSAEIISGSIGYGPVTTMGGQFTTGSPTSNTWGGSRPISSSALTAHGLLDDGATIWFSATAAVSESGSGYVQVALANNSFATGGGNQYIADEGTQVGAGIGFSFKADNGFSAATFGNTKEDAVVAPWDNGKSPRYYSGDSGIVVGKITWGATPQDPDTIEIYEPNTDLLLPAEPTSVLTTQVDQSTFDTLTFFRGGTPLVDEIRFGSTYRSVLLGSVAMAADAVPPVPDPPGFHAAPAPSGPASIQMVAVSAYDPHGVEYYFTCTAGGGHDSGWQSSPEYTDTGLTPGVAYSYTVKARDRSTARNETTASAAFPTTIPTSGAVPLVLSVPQAEAEALIMEKGFAVGSVTTASSSSVDQGNVAEQNPAPGATSPLGAAVDLVISETPLRATIPDLTGQTQAAATTSLSDLDLFVGTVLTDYSETVAAGQIISTNPAAGSQVVPGSDVDLLVSAGALSDLPPLTELFFDDFESPVIADPTGYNLENTTQDIDTTKWVRTTTGYAANENGLVHEDENSGNTFSDPTGSQAWAGRYDTNTGLTSAFNQIGAIEAGLTITVTFDAVLDGYASSASASKQTNGTDLEAALVLFDGAGTRDDQSGKIDAFTSAVLANLTGDQGVNGSYQTFSFSYTVGDAVIDNNGDSSGGTTTWDPALLGQDIAVRFGPGNHAIIDNVRVSSEGTPVDDMVAPGLTSISPADGTTGVGVDDDLKLVFSENVFAGNGTFTLRNETDGTRQYFSADDADTVTFSGNTVVLRPAGGLLTDKDYTVFVSAGAVEDAIGNLFAGISASDEWNFTTSSSGAPVFAVDPITGSDATEDAAYSDTIAGSASDPDGDVLTYAKVSGPAWMSVASDGTLSGTPTNSDVGANSFTVSASDGTDTTQAKLTIQVLSLFEDWAGEGSTPGNDGNGDGVADGLAWVLGASDASVDATELLPKGDAVSDPQYYIFTYRRADEPHNDSNTSIDVIYGEDMSAWTTAVHDGSNIVIAETDDYYATGVDRVEVKLHRDLVTGDTIFARLRVEM